MTPEEIRELREKFGVTQSTWGAWLGVHEQTVSRWERGELSPGHWYLSLMWRIAPAADDEVFVVKVKKQKRPLDALRMLLQKTSASGAGRHKGER